MEDLRLAFEEAGFHDVKTLLASGNVVFSAEATPASQLERRIESATEKHFGKPIPAYVHRIATLERLVASDPFARFELPRDSKRIVSFLRKKPAKKLTFPIVREKARILGVDGTTVYSAYQPQPGNPVFMVLLADTFGTAITTRTWETLTKVAGSE